PLPVENQVLIIYALTKGYLDDIPVEDITRFESELNQWAKSNASELLDEIKTSGALPNEDAFESAITEFKKSFSKTEA
ncbi:MAG: F0F1 ATP synthase subunit alpha, partial [Staphylococcus equorum]|nr:F0F1 ATP synthase subunit alpha [Staphylococcus equorum]